MMPNTTSATSSVKIDSNLLRSVKIIGAKRGITAKKLVEAAIRDYLSKPPSKEKQPK